MGVEANTEGRMSLNGLNNIIVVTDIDHYFHLFQYMEKHNEESRYNKTLEHELWDLSEFTFYPRCLPLIDF